MVMASSWLIVLSAAIGAVATLFGASLALHRQQIREILIDLLVEDLPELSAITKRAISEEDMVQVRRIARKATVVGRRMRHIGYELMELVDDYRKQGESPTQEWYRANRQQLGLDVKAAVTGRIHELRNHAGLIAEYKLQPFSWRAVPIHRAWCKHGSWRRASWRGDAELREARKSRPRV